MCYKVAVLGICSCKNNAGEHIVSVQLALSGVLQLSLWCYTVGYLTQVALGLLSSGTRAFKNWS